MFRKLCFLASILTSLFLPLMTYGAGVADQSEYEDKQVAGATITQGQLLKFDGVGKVIPTTAATDVAVGVAVEAGVLDESIYVECRGEIMVSATVGITKGQFLIPSTTAGKVDGSTTFVQGVVGKALANESGGLVLAYLFRLGKGYFSLSGEGTSAIAPATMDFVVGEQGTSDDGGVIMGTGGKFFVITDNGTATVDGIITSDQGYKLDITDDLGGTAYYGIHAAITDNANTAGQNAVTGGFFDVRSTIGANNTTVIGKLGQVFRAGGTAGAGEDTWYGLWGKVDGDGQLIDTGYGVYGLAIDADLAYGGYFKTISAGTANAALFATATGAATTSYGIYATASGATTNYAAYLDGDVLFAGDEKISNPNGSFLFTDSGGASLKLVLDATNLILDPSTAGLKIASDLIFENGAYVTSADGNTFTFLRSAADNSLVLQMGGGSTTLQTPQFLRIQSNGDARVTFFDDSSGGEFPTLGIYGRNSENDDQAWMTINVGNGSVNDAFFTMGVDDDDTVGKFQFASLNGTVILDGTKIYGNNLEYFDFSVEGSVGIYDSGGDSIEFDLDGTAIDINASQALRLQANGNNLASFFGDSTSGENPDLYISGWGGGASQITWLTIHAGGASDNDIDISTRTTHNSNIIFHTKAGYGIKTGGSTQYFIMPVVTTDPDGSVTAPQGAFVYNSTSGRLEINVAGTTDWDGIALTE